MPGIFKTFRSTYSPWEPRNWAPYIRLLVDNNTGAPVGIENFNANGADAIFTPVDLTAAQIAAPTAAMVNDLNATYRLNVSPYTRYQSNGSALTPLTESAPDGTTMQGAVLQTIPAGSPLQIVGVNSYLNIYAPWTIQSSQGVSVQGSVYVTTRPA